MVEFLCKAGLLRTKEQAPRRLTPAGDGGAVECITSTARKLQWQNRGGSTKRLPPRPPIEAAPRKLMRLLPCSDSGQGIPLLTFRPLANPHSRPPAIVHRNIA